MEGCAFDATCQEACTVAGSACYVEPEEEGGGTGGGGGTDPCSDDYTACMVDSVCEPLMTALTAATTDEDRTPATEACMGNNLCAANVNCHNANQGGTTEPDCTMFVCETASGAEPEYAACCGDGNTDPGGAPDCVCDGAGACATAASDPCSDAASACPTGEGCVSCAALDCASATDTDAGYWACCGSGTGGGDTGDGTGGGGGASPPAGR